MNKFDVSISMNIESKEHATRLEKALEEYLKHFGEHTEVTKVISVQVNADCYYIKLIN